LSPKQYASLLYKRLLGQTPDTATQDKIAYETEQGTLTHESLQKALVQSPEFKALHQILFQPLTIPEKPSAQPKRSCTLPSLRPEEATLRSQIAYGYCLILGRRPEVFGLKSYNLAMLKGLSATDFLL